MSEQHWRPLSTGAVLIVVGLSVLALQSAQGFGEAVPLMVIGGLFMAAYLYQRAYGLLIPGCLLLGLGLGAVGKMIISGAVEFEAIGIGVVFVAIYALSLASVGRTESGTLSRG